MKSHFVIGRNLVRLTLLALAVICINERTVAQADSTDLLPGKSPKLNSVSVNQLLSSGKTPRSAYRARRCLIAGRIEKAQEEITRALHASPHSAVALDIQAAIHLRTGQIEDAANEFQEAIDADPTLGQAYLGLGMLLISRNRLKDALAPLDRAESLLPTSWRAHFETAIAELGLGDMDATLKQIEHAEMLTDSDPEKRSGTAYLRGLVSINQRDYESATRYLDDSIKFNPSGSYAKPALEKLEQIKTLGKDHRVVIDGTPRKKVLDVNF